MRPLVTFDLDHTLWDPDDALRRGEQESHQWLASAVPAFGEQFSPEAFIHWRQQLHATQPDLQHRVSALRRAAFASALEATGMDPQQADRFAREAFDVFWRWRQTVRIFDDTPDLLAQLAGRYTLGALSNGNACLHSIGLMPHFAFHFAAEDFPAAKPAPDLFLAALQHAGHAASDSVHVGDHPVDDIQGARAVGMKTLWVNLHGQDWPTHLPPPDARVGQLAAIPSALASLLGR